MGTIKAIIIYLRYVWDKKRDNEELTPHEKVLLHFLLSLFVSTITLLASIVFLVLSLTYKPMQDSNAVQKSEYRYDQSEN